SPPVSCALLPPVVSRGPLLSHRPHCQSPATEMRHGCGRLRLASSLRPHPRLARGSSTERLRVTRLFDGQPQQGNNARVATRDNCGPGGRYPCKDDACARSAVMVQRGGFPPDLVEERE